MQQYKDCCKFERKSKITLITVGSSDIFCTNEFLYLGCTRTLNAKV